MNRIVRPPLVLLLSISLVASACGAMRAGGGGRGEGQVITADMIRESGLKTGWDVLRRYADHLRVEDGGGIGARRGRESVYLAEVPLLVLDGVRIADLRALRTVPASDIQSMRILSALQASTRYGSRAASGAVVVATLNR